MIYLTNGNMPLNAAYADEIVQEGNSTYQLSFRFPTSDSLWEQLKEETFLTADDIHGEQDFVIFEVEKKHGYIQVYANQVFTLLNNYVVSSLTLDQATGSTALSRFAGAITRNNPFSFFSDIEDRHTFNIGSKNAMEAFAKDKHSILGQWGGDLVRHGYQVRLLKNGGSENESLFMYKKNLSSYQHKTSTKSLKTRITFKTTVKGEGEKAPDRTFTVTIDSPLINKYSQIYENVIEVNDQDVKDEASLRKYGEQYFRTTLCDMMEDSLELEVVGQSDVPVQMFDIVSLFHDVYNLDVRKKITKYTYSPMGKKLKTIGFGQFKSGLANAIGNAVSDAVKGEAQQLQSDFERQLARELKNANLAFDRQKEEFVNQFTDGLNAAKARAEEALRNAGASSLLAQEAKRIGEQARADITNLQNSSQNALNQIESFKTQYGTKLNEVKSTADSLFTKMGAVETYISKDGQRQESLQRYARDESARQVSAVREQISRDYVGKSAYQEDVRGLERRFSAMSTQTNNDIATKISQYKQTVDGRFANLTSQIAGKANQVDFQRVRETSQLYERIIGSNENDISNKVARMAMTNQLFQVEVSKNEGLKTVQRQLAGSWSVQNINSAGDIISGINLGANGYNRFDGKLTHITGETLIDKAVIKSAMVDKLKTGNFEAGSVTSTIIGAEAVTADKVRMDQAFANKLVASNIFTDMLAAKEAFINKLRSVVVTATFLEGFQGEIGGFRFGKYANRNGYFITGINSVSIGMGNGTNAGANRNAFWANWGESLDTPGPKAWYVNTDGKMYCRNDVDFYSKVDFASTSKVNFYSRINAPRGIWIGYDDVEGEGDNPDGGYNRVVWWSQIVTGKWRQHAGITTGSDRKLKENIEPTSVKALDKINALNLVAFDYIKDKTHEEIGLIAQEVLDIIPGAVEKYEGEDNHLTINYSKFVPYLIKAIQELNQKLEEVA